MVKLTEGTSMSSVAPCKDMNARKSLKKSVPGLCLCWASLFAGMVTFMQHYGIVTMPSNMITITWRLTSDYQGSVTYFLLFPQILQWNDLFSGHLWLVRTLRLLCSCFPPFWMPRCFFAFVGACTNWGGRRKLWSVWIISRRSFRIMPRVTLVKHWTETSRQLYFPGQKTVGKSPMINMLSVCGCLPVQNQ